jgi:hypothetical protein
VLWTTTFPAYSATIFESGMLGPTGLAQGTVTASNITRDVFAGVRFRLDAPIETTQIGGHFVSATGGSFFGAIVRLADDNDFPDSGDLSTFDVLGNTEIAFPVSSAEVLGSLEVSLDPGWYALVFGAGLFGTSGDGAAPVNNPDIGTPSYIAYQPGSVTGWSNPINPVFRNLRFVLEGRQVPEPSLIAFLVPALVLFGHHDRTSRKHSQVVRITPKEGNHAQAARVVDQINYKAWPNP